MFTGSKQTVRFESSVSGATVMCNTRIIGQTNQDIEIQRSDLDGLFRISMEGCKTKEIELQLHTTKSYWLNIPLFMLPYLGTFAAIFDLGVGNAYKTDDVIKIELDCSK
jgi:hypothetical protein